MKAENTEHTYLLNSLMFCFIFSGSGFMISGRRVLTNAHCVEHHTQVDFLG